MSKPLKKALQLIFPDDLQCPICEGYQRLDALGICRRCQSKLQVVDFELSATETPYQRLLACYRYNDTARKLITRHKRNHQRYLSRLFAKMIVEKLNVADIIIDTVTWIPTDSQSKRVRGCDHAEDIARAVADQINCQRRCLLKKRRLDKPQKTLSKRERFANMADAFECTTPLSVGDRVLVVDDVITTGATIISAARSLSLQYPQVKLYGIAVFATLNRSLN